MADATADLVDDLDTEELVDPDAEIHHQSAPAQADVKPNLTNADAVAANAASAAPAPGAGGFSQDVRPDIGGFGQPGPSSNLMNAQGQNQNFGGPSGTGGGDTDMDRMKPNDMPDEGSVILLYLLLDFLYQLSSISLPSSHYSLEKDVSSVATRRQHRVHKYLDRQSLLSLVLGRPYSRVNTDECYVPLSSNHSYIFLNGNILLEPSNHTTSRDRSTLGTS